MSSACLINSTAVNRFHDDNMEWTVLFLVSGALFFGYVSLLCVHQSHTNASLPSAICLESTSPHHLIVLVCTAAVVRHVATS